MKKTNKGFSMVELIIVIAIMAILAGALAPALIKYINKSRLSTDVQTGNSIASALQSAFGEEDAYSDAKDVDKAKVSEVFKGTEGSNTKGGGDFTNAFVSALNLGEAPSMKSKKDLGGTAFPSGCEFSVSFKADGSSLTIWAGNTDDDHMVYPSVGSSMAK